MSENPALCLLRWKAHNKIQVKKITHTKKNWSVSKLPETTLTTSCLALLFAFNGATFESNFGG